MEILHFIIKNLACFFPIIPAIIGLTFFNKLKKSEKIITILSILGFLICWVSAIGTIRGNNMRSLHLWTVLEFSCVSAFYYVLFHNKKLKYLIGIISIGFIAFSIINSLFIQGIYTYNSHARGLEVTLLTIYSLVYLIYIINNENFFLKKYTSIKFIVLAMIIYFGLNQFLFLTYNYISVFAKQLSSLAFDFHGFLNLIFNTLLAIGLWKKKSKQT